MKISIIIPVYNVEKYLGKCLDSVICQTLDDIEIICINDGSTDKSYEILNAYARKDKRIVVINNKNNGAAQARNDGLDIANGQYIMFVDGDDYLKPWACETAYKKITSSHSDIGIFSHLNEENSNCIESSKNGLIKKYSDDSSLTDYSCFQIFIWDKIYKKSFLDRNNIRFEQDVKTSEDTIWCWCCLLKNPKYCFIEQPLYVYRINHCGAATNDFKTCIKNDITAVKKFHDMPVFRSLQLDIKLKIISAFCKGALCYWNNFYKFSQRKILVKDINNLLKFLEKFYEPKDLNSLKSYRILKHLYFYTIINFIFSIINSKSGTRKIITILGFKIKIKRYK